jgi:hypothetical protein
MLVVCIDMPCSDGSVSFICAMQVICTPYNGLHVIVVEKGKTYHDFLEAKAFEKIILEKKIKMA